MESMRHERESRTESRRSQSLQHADERLSTKVGDGIKFNITFENLSYGVHVDGKSKEPKWLLKNVTGSINPRQMTALMGPSGAGKSTLLEVLAGRKSTGVVEGSLLFNGKERTREMKRWFGFVEQRDSLIATITVRETLMYTARLRMKANGLNDEGDRMLQDERVDEILSLLGLQGCADVIIGDEGNRGVSGGQAKRVNAGMELITNPSILFLDEPTSGLDSATSLDFISCIKDVCNRGVCVICTIHQPSTDVYKLFDRLLLLVAGEVVYLGDAQNAPSYFEEHGFKRPPKQNPADYLVSVTAGHPPMLETPETKSWPDIDPKFWVETYQKSAMAEARKISTIKHRDEVTRSELSRDVDLYANGFYYNTAVLTQRAWDSAKRDKSFFFKRVIGAIMVGIIFMLAYLSPGYDQAAIRAKQSVLMLSLTYFIFSFNAIVGPTIQSRDYSVREINANSYSVHSYFLSTVIFESPWNVVKAVLWSVVIYWACDLKREVGAFFFFMMVTFFIAETGLNFALTFSFFFPTADVASMAMVTLPLLFMLFSGFFIARPDIPDYWIWAYYISFVNYGLSAYLLNEFSGNYEYCGSYNYTIGSEPLYAYTPCDSDVPYNFSSFTTNMTLPYTIPPDETISGMGIPLSGFQSDMWQNFGMILVIWAGTRVLAFMALRFVKHGRMD
ncbi:hypothetical protein SARC_11150 [Sphaeroforma arctica JP610]|uniref:ABC transporter domain-containing protein n=1 Tax=Sphaeroforma arctica JP610 TaxID=667725 RepID=A0A0L0FJX1_9EUKA|nr:hypothetical protein SARC_11150 [Sphaeroforma arctica JP610]KNC76343.1 hypothetical protein SARC_11150 [Sphaeroforma arctica JP610]|eukprot:XP_014150245.1 hypothetical protein SARC_11150 [Sphaeroforma arctica JP610]